MRIAHLKNRLVAWACRCEYLAFPLLFIGTQLLFFAELELLRAHLGTTALFALLGLPIYWLGFRMVLAKSAAGRREARRIAPPPVSAGSDR